MDDLRLTEEMFCVGAARTHKWRPKCRRDAIPSPNCPYPLLCQHLLNYVAAKVGELFVPAVVQEPETVLVEPQQLQYGGMEVAHVIPLSHAAQTQFVGLADRYSRLHTAAGKPHGVPVRIMVASVAALRHRQAPELRS